MIKLYIILVTVIVDIDGYTHLDLIFQNTFGLCIKKTPGIKTVNEHFHMKWHSIIKNAEKQLIELLLFE